MIEILKQKLIEDEYVTLETTPGHSATIDNLIDEISKYEFCNKIDGFSTTDNPLSKLKYNSILAGIKLQQRFKKPVIATMSMRDRNKIALQSDLLGANDFDIRAILALTGDPASMSDQPNTKAVLEGNSTLLLQMIKSFNSGMDYAGKPFKVAPKPILPFSVTNSYAKNFSTIKKKMSTKIKEGSVGIITQPVFDIDNAKELLQLFNSAREDFSDMRASSQLIFGIFPIVRLRTAQFLSSHVPGIYVPDVWLDKLRDANKIGEEEERKVGMQLSKDLYIKIKSLHPKMHIMTANKFDIADELFK